MKIKNKIKYLFAITCLILQGMFYPQTTSATTEKPGTIPENVGKIWISSNCEYIKATTKAVESNAQSSLAQFTFFAKIPLYVFKTILFIDCWEINKVADKTQKVIKQAYKDREDNKLYGQAVSPGIPIEDGKIWKVAGKEYAPVLIQRFKSGTFGDGVIMTCAMNNNTIISKSILGSYWKAYLKSAEEWKVFLGCPQNDSYKNGKVYVQEFINGEWGASAIVGEGQADWVTGKFWTTYKKVNGFNTLGNPVSFDNKNRIQTFQYGKIRESDMKVCFNSDRCKAWK